MRKRHGCLLPPLGAQMAACSMVSTASSDTGCSLKWRIARWLWMASNSGMFTCIIVEPLTPSFSFTKHRHQEKRILCVAGFYTSEKTDRVPEQLNVVF